MLSYLQTSFEATVKGSGGFYRTYGLAVRSEICLPELTIGSGPADVEFSIRAAVGTRHHARPEETGVRVAATATWLSQPGVGLFRICKGRSIEIEPAAGVEDHVLRLFLLGPALGILLRQRGRLTLHASAVAVRGGAILFVGQSGAGKSTIAAALHARGCPLISDDIVSVDVTDSATVFPGFPQLKLDARAAIAASITTARPGGSNGYDARECLTARHGFSLEPVPLKCIYVLAEDPDGDSIEPLEPSEALLELLRHTYGARSLQALDREAHFKQCAAAARLVAVQRFKRRMGLTKLMGLADAIEADLAKIT